METVMIVNKHHSGVWCKTKSFTVDNHKLQLELLPHYGWGKYYAVPMWYGFPDEWTHNLRDELEKHRFTKFLDLVAYLENRFNIKFTDMSHLTRLITKQDNDLYWQRKYNVLSENERSMKYSSESTEQFIKRLMRENIIQ